MEEICEKRKIEPKKVMRGDWPELKEDMLSLLDMWIDGGEEEREMIESLVRVAFGREASVDLNNSRAVWSVLINPDAETMVGVVMERMKEGTRSGGDIYFDLLTGFGV